MGLSTSVSLENIDRGNDRYKHNYPLITSEDIQAAIAYAPVCHLSKKSFNRAS